MRYVRLCTRSRAPISPIDEAFRACDDLRHLSLRYGGVPMSKVPTYIYEVAGDLDEIAASLDAHDGVYEAEVTPIDGPGHEDEGYCYVRGETSELELSIRRTFSQRSLVTVPPVVFEGEEAYFHVIGRPADLQPAIEEAREELPVEVERIGEYDRPNERETAALTARQRDALVAGIEVGYYDVPRCGTHEDVAASLGCAPSTASEHLRKGEAALVRELLG